MKNLKEFISFNEELPPANSKIEVIFANGTHSIINLRYQALNLNATIPAIYWKLL